MAVLASPVLLLVTVTLAPGTAAPEGSVTVPARSPEMIDWALRVPGSMSNARSARLKATKIFLTGAFAKRCGQRILM